MTKEESLKILSETWEGPLEVTFVGKGTINSLAFDPPGPIAQIIGFALGCINRIGVICDPYQWTVISFDREKRTITVQIDS